MIQLRLSLAGWNRNRKSVFSTLDNTARSASDANNDLMESGPKLTPTVFPAYLSGVGNELWRGQKLKWSPENCISPLLSFLFPTEASLGLLLVRPSLTRIPAGDKNNRLFHYWPLASPKVHYNPECIFGGRTAGDRQTKGRKCRHILALSPFPRRLTCISFLSEFQADFPNSWTIGRFQRIND